MLALSIVTASVVFVDSQATHFFYAKYTSDNIANYDSNSGELYSTTVNGSYID